MYKMQRLEVSGAVRLIYTYKSLGVKRLIQTVLIVSECRLQLTVADAMHG